MKLFLFFVIIFFCTLSFSQEIIAKGKIADIITKKPLSGASVYKQNKTRVTATNFNGEYAIRIRLGDTLVFSYIGYKTIKHIANETKLTIFLQENSVQLDEVQITAKANINDIDYRKGTGAITTISINKIQDRASVNIIESLQGQVAGLVVKSDGELGKPLKIRIRGTSTLPIKIKGIKEEDKVAFDNKANQPLFVLDGQIISAEAFAILNVNDIKNIKVLKDAAANALYGIKAANGVIEITGKRGINGKTQYSFSFQQGITLRGKPSVKMMNTAEKLSFEFKSKNTRTPGYYLSEEYFRIFNSSAVNLNELIVNGAIKLDSLKQIDTDWFKKLTRISTYQSYNFSARGGGKKNMFYISSNFTKQGGKFNGNNINRFTGRLNYEHNLTKNLHIMLNAGLGFSENNTPNSSTYTPSELIYVLNPYEQPNNTSKLVSYYNKTFANLVNQFSKKNQKNRFNFSANLFAKFSKNWHLSTIVGLDYLGDESLAITPRTAFTERSSYILENEKGKASKNKTVMINYSTNTRLNFDKNLGNHKISASTNIDFYKSKNNFIGIAGYGLPSKLNSGAGINNDITGSRRARTSSSKTTEAQLGFGFSGLYGWNDKIEIYGSYKKDGASLLPSTKRWNIFWATGIGYTLSNEPFLKDNKWLSYLKLRSTYGVTASLSGITASLAVPTFTYGTDGYLGIRKFYLKDLYNNTLRPEKNTSINLGLDVGIANNISISIEAYHRRTKDMLLTVPIAPSNGFLQQLKNVGIMDNKGLEFSLTGSFLSTDNFTWSTSANLSYNENKVIDLYEGTELNYSNNPYPDYKEGAPVDLIYGLINLGVHPADGVPRFKRADGTEFHGDLEKPRATDFVVLGRSTPPYSGGWFHNLTYNGWQLSLDFYYNFGGKAIYKNQTLVKNYKDTYKNAVSGQLKSTWFAPGDERKLYPSLQLHGKEIYNNRLYGSTRTIGETDFIRLNNVMLRYRFSEAFLKKTSSYVHNWQMYIQLKNIATLSNFRGGDPESANLVGSYQPIITLGANLTF